MHFHEEQQQLPFTPEQMFDLVADIEKYPEFLPWCVGLRLLSRDENRITADLMVGYKMIRETFTSEVALYRPDRIDVTYKDGPFRHLLNEWEFLPDGAGGTIVDFAIEFEFRNHFLERMMGFFFDEAVMRMVTSFKERAYEIYGDQKRLR